jgi:alcohol dehydrogenase
MKALIFGGPGQRSWESTADPGISEPTDVIVKVAFNADAAGYKYRLIGSAAALGKGVSLGFSPAEEPRPRARSERSRTTSLTL